MTDEIPPIVPLPPPSTPPVTTVTGDPPFEHHHDHNDNNSTLVSTPDPTILANERWFSAYWRPAAAWVYLAICVFDFVLAPTLNAMFFAYSKIVPFVQWTPLTLQGGGLFHLSFGAIIGIYTWVRTKEKMFDASGGDIK